MRVLVTGHLGYIGACLVPALIRAGHEVLGSDSDLFRRCDFGAFAPVAPNTGKDVRDLTAGELEGVDAVIHLAGLSNDPLGELDPALTDEVNLRATVRLGRLARQAGVRRFVFSSSCSTYGAAGESWVDERAAFEPVTAYGRSKVDAEAGLSALASPGFSPVYLRNATVYGYSPRIRFDLVVNNLVAWAHTTGRVFLKSKGLAWRPLVHVEDVAAAFVAALETPREAVHDQAFNIGRTEENFRVCELADRVVAAIPGARLDMAEGAQADRRSYRVNCDKAAATLTGWKPRWGVADGIAELWSRYRREGLCAPDFEGPRYQRVAHLRMLLGSGSLNADLRPACEKLGAMAGA